MVVILKNVYLMNNYKCSHCNYEGPCYGIPTSQGVLAPFCKQCQMNDGLIKIGRCNMDEEIKNVKEMYFEGDDLHVITDESHLIFKDAQLKGVEYEGNDDVIECTPVKFQAFPIVHGQEDDDMSWKGWRDRQNK